MRSKRPANHFTGSSPSLRLCHRNTRPEVRHWHPWPLWSRARPFREGGSARPHFPLRHLRNRKHALRPLSLHFDPSSLVALNLSLCNTGSMPRTNGKAVSHSRGLPVTPTTPTTPTLYHHWPGLRHQEPTYYLVYNLKLTSRKQNTGTHF